MNKLNRPPLIILVLIATLTLAACGDAAPAVTSTPIVQQPTPTAPDKRGEADVTPTPEITPVDGQPTPAEAQATPAPTTGGASGPGALGILSQ